MNKIIQINLAGQAVSIDEQAFTTLSQYLGTLEIHFKNTESAKEILDDIEARIAELFFSKLKNNAFINEKHVNEAIALMGTAKDMGADDDYAAEEPHIAYSQDRSKKLFRDKEDSVFGGVCSGIGAYFGLDASAIRILFVLLVVIAGAPIVAYIILWAVIPEAKTPQDRYRMNGDASTISDIANNIRDEASRVSSNLKQGADKFSEDLKKNGKLNKNGNEILHGIGQIATFFGKAFGAFTLIILVTIGIVAAVGLLSNATGGFHANINGIGFDAPALFNVPTLNWIFSISLLSLILIPIGTVIYAILQFIFDWANTINLKGIFLAWLVSLAIFIGVTVYSAKYINTEKIKDFIENIDNEINDDIEELDRELHSETTIDSI
jgi:phage shock protein PspC (stress-responsive transcriptional regulator)